MEKPYTGKASVEESFNQTIITIPSARNIFAAIFLGIWLCAWAGGECMAIGMGVFAGGVISGFMLVWLAGWTAGGIFAFRALVWMVSGKEIITVGQGELTVAKKNLLFFKPKTYSLSDAKKFRVRDDSANMGYYGRQNNLGGFGNTGTIQFDYGMKTVKFAAGVDEAEASYLLQKLKEKHLLTERNF